MTTILHDICIRQSITIVEDFKFLTLINRITEYYVFLGDDSVVLSTIPNDL